MTYAVTKDLAKTVVITGANGQVGRELQRAIWPETWTIVALASADLDITNATDVEQRLAEIAPDVIVNAAAYTAVDNAEADEDRATLVNATAVSNLATAANATDAFLVHISTDYVFDGTSKDWYTESDPLCPLGAYGRSKAAGEAAAAQASKHVVLRTAWVYGALGSNFVTTMLRLAADRDVLGVVADQFGCPTSAKDIADSIIKVATAQSVDESLPSDLYHLVAPDDASWFEVAETIFAESSRGFSGQLNALTTDQYPTPTARPANSRLASNLIFDDLGIRLPPWRQSLRQVVQELEGV